MQSAIFKFVALAGVIGIGSFVVLEVHRRLPTPETQNSDGSQFAYDEAIDDAPEPSDPESEEDDLPPVQSLETIPEQGVAVRDELPVSSPPDWFADDGEVFDPGLSGQTEPPPSTNSDDEWTDVPIQSVEATDADAGKPFASDADEEMVVSVAEDSERSFFPSPPAASTDVAGMPNDEPQPFSVESTESSSIQPVAAEEPVAESASFDPFSEDSVAEDPEVDADADPQAAPVLNLFGPEAEAGEEAFVSDDASAGSPGLAEPVEPVEPLLFPADPDEAGFAETTAPPREPVVVPSPFDGTMPVDAEETTNGIPLEDEDAEDPFDPFGAREPAEPDDADSVLPEESEEPSPLLLESPDTDEPTESEPLLPFGDEFDDSPESVPAFPESESGEAPLLPEGTDDEEMPVIRGNPTAPAFDLSPEADELPDVRPLTEDASRPVPEFDSARPDSIGEGTLTDGAPRGTQQPELTIEKVAPQAANVGEPLIYAIRVRNAGNSTAHDVLIEDRVPRGTELDGTIPQAELIQGRLVWRLGEMEPGHEELIRIRVVPKEAGEIGSVATVRFVAEVAAKTVVTLPELSLAVEGPSEVAVGEQAVFRFVISNTGEAEARNVYIENVLPPALQHPGGEAIECDIGTLAVGESREVELSVTAARAGPVTTQASAYIGKQALAQAEASVSILDSRLSIERKGPDRRFVGRPADYSTVVTNRSRTALRQIRIVEQLPEGLELAGIPKGGKFDPIKRTIVWTIDELPAGESRRYQTSVVARTAGSMQSIVRAGDADGNGAELRSRLEVAGFESLALDLEHDGRPVAVGEQVSLRMTVRNRGTGPAHDVRTAFRIPENLEFVEARGPVEYRQQGQTIEFATINELAADEVQSFDIVLTAAQTGPTQVTAQLETPKLGAPLRHDASVVVQSDEP